MAIDSSTGALTLTSGSPFATGKSPISVTVHPSGKFLYVANLASNNISAYTIDSTTGVATQLTKSPFAAGTEPVFVTSDPAGKFLYVCNQSAKNIFQFAISADNGGIPSSTISTTTNLAPAELVFAK